MIGSPGGSSTTASRPASRARALSVSWNAEKLCVCQVPGRQIERRPLPPEQTGSTGDLVRVAFAAKDPLKELQRELIRRVLQDRDGDLRAAAARLGISRTT